MFYLYFMEAMHNGLLYLWLFFDNLVAGVDAVSFWVSNTKSSMLSPIIKQTGQPHVTAVYIKLSNAIPGNPLLFPVNFLHTTSWLSLTSWVVSCCLPVRCHLPSRPPFLMILGKSLWITTSRYFWSLLCRLFCQTYYNDGIYPCPRTVRGSQTRFRPWNTGLIE